MASAAVRSLDSSALRSQQLTGSLRIHASILERDDPARCDHRVGGRRAHRQVALAARFFKTRSLAATAVLGGRVHVNGERVKPSKVVHANDVLEISKGTERWTVTVEQLAERRGSATAAQALYREADESRTAREQHALEGRF